MANERGLNLIWGAILALSGLIFAIRSLKYPLGSLQDPGPGFLPLLVGAFVLLLALALVISNRIPGPSSRVASQEEAHAKKGLNGVLLVVLLCAYVLIMEYLTGFLIATAVFLLIVQKVLGVRGLIVPVAVALAVDVIIFWGLGVALSADLPGVGPLERWLIYLR